MGRFYFFMTKFQRNYSVNSQDQPHNISYSYQFAKRVYKGQFLFTSTSNTPAIQRKRSDFQSNLIEFP